MMGINLFHEYWRNPRHTFTRVIATYCQYLKREVYAGFQMRFQKLPSSIEKNHSGIQTD